MDPPPSGAFRMPRRRVRTAPPGQGGGPVEPAGSLSRSCCAGRGGFAILLRGPGRVPDLVAPVGPGRVRDLVAPERPGHDSRNKIAREGGRGRANGADRTRGLPQRSGLSSRPRSVTHFPAPVRILPADRARAGRGRDGAATFPRHCPLRAEEPGSSGEMSSSGEKSGGLGTGAGSSAGVRPRREVSGGCGRGAARRGAGRA